MATCIVFPAVPLLKLKANCLHCWLLQAPTRSSFCSYSNIWDICQKYFLVKYFQFLNSSASGKLFLGCCQAHLIVSKLTWTALSKITLENSWQDFPLQICGVCWRVTAILGGEWTRCAEAVSHACRPGAVCRVPSACRKENVTAHCNLCNLCNLF